MQGLGNIAKGFVWKLQGHEVEYWPSESLWRRLGGALLPTPGRGDGKSFATMRLGVFLGYRLAPGGNWNNEYLVADLEWDFWVSQMVMTNNLTARNMQD